MPVEDTVCQCCTKLKKKAILLDDFARITARLMDNIASGDEQALAGGVKERQKTIHRICAIDRELDILSSRPDFSIDRISEASRHAVGECLTRIKASLERLAGMDRECLALAGNRCDTLRSGVLKMRAGLQLARGYGRTSIRPPRFLDLKR